MNTKNNKAPFFIKSTFFSRIAIPDIFTYPLNETQILLLSGIIVGIGTGIGAVIFRELIARFTYFFFHILRPLLETILGTYAIIIIPAIGALIFGPLIYFFAREAKGHGVPEVMYAVAQKGGKIRPVVALVKSLASALCIGSGGSVGREGPIVQIGSALGSTWGQLFNMSESRVKMLVACGAAGGIAATFNAPIAGVFFALEVIIGEFSSKAFGIVVIASVTASVIGRMAFGDVPAFPLPEYTESMQEIPFYILLGVLGAFIGIWFMKTLYWFEDRFDAIKIPEYIKPVTGALLLGTLALFVPQILGVGYPAMSDALSGHYAFDFLALLVLAKIIAVSLTLGAGGSGGVFAPSLFIGAMFGEAFGTLMQKFYPSLIFHPSNFGLVGMAAVFTGAARAPITAIIILFELTGNYAIILPLMAAIVISTIVSESLSKETIYTLKLKRRGIDIYADRTSDIMKKLKVHQAISTNFIILKDVTIVTKAIDRLKRKSHHAILVKDKKNNIIGIVTLYELEQEVINSNEKTTLKEIIRSQPSPLYEYESLADAVRKMEAYDQKILPVFSSKESIKPTGVINHETVFKAYSQALLAEHKR